jgi:hypothetical protein
MGRPRFEITPEILQKTERLAAQGLTQVQISACLGINVQKTLIEKKRAFSEFSDAIKNGRAKGIGTITNALFDSAVKGSVPAQIFYLKNRDQDNWSDVQAHNVSVVAKLSDSQLLEEVKSDPKLIEALETSVVGSKSLESIKEL